MSTEAFLPSLSVAVVGQCDSGKSTIVGHLRYQCGCVSERVMDKLTQESADRGKNSYKFAWLNDTRKAERERGVTIETTESQLLTAKYELALVDTPGHNSFMKNAIPGVSTADHALLVVDANDYAYESGMQEGGATKEHALIAFALGAKQVIVAVNKMDAPASPYAQERFDTIKRELGAYLATIGFQHEHVQFIPMSGWHGENLAHNSTLMPWYDGATLLEALDKLTPPERASNKPLRLPIQDVYQIAGVGLVITGRVQTGVLKRGMQLSFGPSGVKGTVFSIECYHRQVTEASPGMAVGVNIKGDLSRKDIKRGFVASDASCDEARAASEFITQLVFLQHPITQQVRTGFSPIVHCHTAQVACRIQKIVGTLDRQSGDVLQRPANADGEVDGELTVKSGDACVLVFKPLDPTPTVFEAFREYPALGRIVVRDGGATIAVGIIRSVEKVGVWKP